MKRYFKRFWVAGVLLAATSSQSSEVANPLFAYTHLLPSPFTLPAGRLAFGTDVALGVTDFFEVGTGLLRDFYKFYNANAKVSVIDYPEFAAALTLGFQTYNLKDVDLSNPDLKVTSWMPGLVTSFELLPRVALFLGANLSFTNAVLNTSGIETSGYITGASTEADITWAYNPATKKRKISNAISTGASYDFTYKIYGVGISHHWPGFHLGIHYYPNASQYKVLPIISGGGSIDL